MYFAMYNNNNSNQSVLLDHGCLSCTSMYMRVLVTLHVYVRVCVCVCVYACACVLLTSKSSAFSCVFMLQSDIHITAYTSILFQENGKAGLFSSLTVLGSDWSEGRSPFFPLASLHDPAGAG